MLEAMRILSQAYPNPKRTILIGLWGSEEQGLNGSRAFVKDHPEIVQNLQALFNQDNGTGRVSSMSGSGFIDASGHLARWLSRVPGEITQEIKFSFPGMPAGGGTDHSSFDAAGVPGFGLGSNSWDYFTYTWHTNRDTYDKLVFADLKNNAVLAAILAYCASEDSLRVPRERRSLPLDRRTGKQRTWPSVEEPIRK
jgi:Zn-dependent M28 family amino/carboxypeptidase